MNLRALVGKSYPSPEWAVFFEVSNSTGFGASRRADAVALGIWPSRGQALIGFEFKEDRRDWLREKDNPAKAEAVASHCDRWYVVAGADGIVKVEELPDPWGLYVANADRTKLLTKKSALPFPDRDTSVMKRTFVASMLRKVTEATVPKVELDRIVEERVKLAVEATRQGRDLKYLQERVEQLQGILDTFKQVTGVDMKDWRGPEKISAAVAAVLDADQNLRAMQDAHKRLELAARDMATAIENWPALQKPVESGAGA